MAISGKAYQKTALWLKGKAKHGARKCKDLDVLKADRAKQAGPGHTLVLSILEVFLEGNKVLEASDRRRVREHSR